MVQRSERQHPRTRHPIKDVYLGVSDTKGGDNPVFVPRNSNYTANPSLMAVKTLDNICFTEFIGHHRDRRCIRSDFKMGFSMRAETLTVTQESS